MAKELEQQIKNAIFDWIKFQPRKGFAWSVYNGAVYDPKIGCYRKPPKNYRKGVPDICGIWCNRPLFIEVKTKTGVVSDEQKSFINQARENGAIAFVARDLETVVSVLSRVALPSSLDHKPTLASEEDPQPSCIRTQPKLGENL